MGFEDDVQGYNEQWSEAQDAPRSGGARLPDGRHQVQVVEFRLEQREDKDWEIQAKFQNQAGSVRKWYNLGHEVARNIAAADTKLMGYDGPLSGLRAWIESEEPIGLICEVNVKTKAGNERDFTDVYVNRVLGKAELQDFSQGGDAPVAAGKTSVVDDDIPFAPTSMTSGHWGI